MDPVPTEPAPAPAPPRPSPPAARIASWVVAGVLLLLILPLKLLPALLSGLLVYQLVHTLAPVLGSRVPGERARMIAVALLAAAIVGLLTLAIIGVIAFFRSDTGNMNALLDKMMEIIEQARGQLPAAVGAYLPNDINDARVALSTWLHEHGQQVQIMGKHAVEGFVHVLVGMVLGALIALDEVIATSHSAPFASELHRRCVLVADSFRRIVFAQIRISGLNTLFTALFLFVILPLAGVQLPLAKTMIVLTFCVGLLPIIGNLISNTVITVIALSVSIYVAIMALVFLVVIHKLEYFLNAKIVGGQISARAWELLTAMLIMEAAFGLSGLIAAPIYYAYAKRVLVEQGWV